MIVGTAPARVGLLGNPSDIYGGRTLALAVPRFEATVEVEPAAWVEIVETEADRPRWDSVPELVERVDHHGYGTGPQLLAATVRTLVDVAASVDHPGLGRGGFVLRYHTTIPRSVGLGGSSALVVAALRALGTMIDLELPDDVLASVALRVETEQLGITAGLQDRVVQALGGLVAMNFGEMTTDARYGVACGEYRQVDPSSLPPLFVAYRASAAAPSGDYHRALRRRWEEGDATVRDTLHHLAGLAVEGEAALRWNDAERFAGLLTENMDLRRLLGPIPPAQLTLVDAAERCGAPATFAGSGGAVVGAYRDEEHLEQIRHEMVVQEAELVVIEVPAGPPPADPVVPDTTSGGGGGGGGGGGLHAVDGGGPDADPDPSADPEFGIRRL